MNRVDEKFKNLKETKKKAFIAYITAGDPTLEQTAELVFELEKQGVDLVELGIPFSDPLADGLENQQAAMRALKHDVSIANILQTVKQIRKKSAIPLIFFTYFNPVFNYGLEKFMKHSAAAGIDGILILDLPPEESTAYQIFKNKYALKTIYLFTPNTPVKRIKLLANLTSGFAYYVSRTGVTGVQTSIEKDIAQKVTNIKKYTNLPVVVGFGISTPSQAAQIGKTADGIVVGSAIVATIRKNAETKQLSKKVGTFVQTLISEIKK